MDVIGPLLCGLDSDWSETDLGFQMIYEIDPSEISLDCAARVIYELRLEVERLNNEIFIKTWQSLNG